jgi:hypothetical protein
VIVVPHSRPVRQILRLLPYIRFVRYVRQDLSCIWTSNMHIAVVIIYSVQSEKSVGKNCTKSSDTLFLSEVVAEEGD